MSYPLFFVDAFTSKPFAGNPAAVCLLEKWPADDWLQLVAREMNLSETAFLVPRSEVYDLRWFTPKVEVDLCGHATLASAHVLWSEGVTAADPLVFHTRSGELRARRADGLIELDFPTTPAQSVEEIAEVSSALGAHPVYFGKTRFDYLIEVASGDALRNMKPDFDRLALLVARGVIVTCSSDDPSFDFLSRFFAPAAGIDEDPVTGSAHCCLGHFWAPRLGRDDLLAYQASQRGGVVHVKVRGERTLLSGKALTVVKGSLQV